jgi:hypothetical protein
VQCTKSMLRMTLYLKTEEVVAGAWRKLRSEVLHNLDCPPDFIDVALNKCSTPLITC